jgi:hypothetical protein
VESIHPYLNEPIVFLSKVLLCECDWSHLARCHAFRLNMFPAWEAIVAWIPIRRATLVVTFCCPTEACDNGFLYSSGVSCYFSAWYACWEEDTMGFALLEWYMACAVWSFMNLAPIIQLIRLLCWLPYWDACDSNLLFENSCYASCNFWLCNYKNRQERHSLWKSTFSCPWSPPIASTAFR